MYKSCLRVCEDERYVYVYVDPGGLEAKEAWKLGNLEVWSPEGLGEEASERSHLLSWRSCWKRDLFCPGIVARSEDQGSRRREAEKQKSRKIRILKQAFFCLPGRCAVVILCSGIVARSADRRSGRRDEEKQRSRKP